jgi:hypothetical protein
MSVWSSQQGADGTPHLAYFDKTHQLSFVWDGTQGDWIDVSYGGYGEPAVARIPWNDQSGCSPAAFQRTCDEFINLIHEIEKTTIGHVPYIWAET